MRAPARDSAEQAASNAAATSGASPSNTCERGTSRRSPSTGIGAGASAGSPAITASAIAQHAMLLASGPIESSVVESGTTPSRGMRCCVGLNPARPHNAAGMRTEPPVSLPIATTACPSPTDTAAPEDEPPGIRRRSCGLPGVP